MKDEVGDLRGPSGPRSRTIKRRRRPQQAPSPAKTRPGPVPLLRESRVERVWSPKNSAMRQSAVAVPRVTDTAELPAGAPGFRMGARKVVRAHVRGEGASAQRYSEPARASGF
eukprot:6709081-Pyramimonas_sp.AAC.1